MSGSPLLEGVTVLDLASVGPAARASRWLSDYGASVVKVAPLPRDGDRRIVPAVHAYGAHRGMRRLAIDLKNDRGRDTFLRLAGTADVVIESFRPGVIDRLGIGYDVLTGVNPQIVLCSTTGYGASGPRAAWAGHDLNYQAVAGYLHCSGIGTDGGPALPGATIADSAAGGLQAVAAICAALWRRDRTGEGAHLDVAVADGMLSLMALTVDEYLATGAEAGPRSGLLTGRYAWYDVYPAGDDRWLAVAAIEGRFFENLCRAIGCDQWIGRQYDETAIADMRADFAAAFSGRSRDDWVHELGPADTCVSPVLDVTEVTTDAHYAARDAFIDAVHPIEGPLRQVGAILAGQLRATRPELPDMASTQSVAVLTEAGFDTDEIEVLVAEGAIG